MKILDLSGAWQCAYTKDGSMPESFPREIAVPAYWDDQPAAFAGIETTTNPEYTPVVYPMPDNIDASLPYITGTVWYRKTVTLEEDAPCAALALRGVSTESRLWVNGSYVGQFFGYSAPHYYSLDGYLTRGENTVLIAVDNDPKGRLGCVTRGYKSFTGGLFRPVILKLTGSCRFSDAAVFAKDAKFFTIDALFDGDTDGAELNYRILDGETIVKEGVFPVEGLSLHRDVLSIGLERWSDVSPKLYTCRLSLYGNGELCDEMSFDFGLRDFRRDGIRLLLNGQPIFLRGGTEHGYYAKTCTPPMDVESYLENLRILKEYGFNFLRFHTSVPNEEYMQAMDQMGFLVQMEAPVNCDEKEWDGILRLARRHPCICIACSGNEELLDEDKLSELSRMARMVHTIAPAMLYNPHEALRGIEYGWRGNDCGECIEEPSRHNPKRLATVHRFSDVFGQYAWGFLSYNSSEGDCHELERRLSVYHRPCLSHEMGIYGGYLDYSLEKRYEGTRIGTDLYSKGREYLQSEGMFDRWEEYFRNSNALMSVIRKHNFETARKCARLAGFDYLGITDHHWHQTGYPCGMLNEFYEAKPYTVKEEVLDWNSPTVLLWDHHSRFTYLAGEAFACTMLVSRFAGAELPAGCIDWTLTDDEGRTVRSGSCASAAMADGGVCPVCSFDIVMPETTGHYRLSAELKAGEETFRNHWDLWGYEVVPEKVPENVRIVDTLDEATLQWMADGGRVLLTKASPLPAEETRFQPMSSGRLRGITGSVINAHPALANYPNAGWCDWQFRSLLNGGTAISYGAPSAARLPVEFKPIIEIITSFKVIDRQAALAEFRVGSGRLMVCGLKLGYQPEQQALRNDLVRYLAGGGLVDAPELTVDYLQNCIETVYGVGSHLSEDQGFDKNGQKKI